MADNDDSSRGCLILGLALFLAPGSVIATVVWDDITPEQYMGRAILISAGLVVALFVLLVGRWWFRRS